MQKSIIEKRSRPDGTPTNTNQILSVEFITHDQSFPGCVEISFETVGEFGPVDCRFRDPEKVREIINALSLANELMIRAQARGEIQTND